MIEREREMERMHCKRVHLARIPRKGSDPLTRVKLPHSLPRAHCIPDDRKFIEFFPRSPCVPALVRVSAILLPARARRSASRSFRDLRENR